MFLLPTLPTSENDETGTTHFFIGQVANRGIMG